MPESMTHVAAGIRRMHRGAIAKDSSALGHRKPSAFALGYAGECGGDARNVYAVDRVALWAPVRSICRQVQPFSSGYFPTASTRPIAAARALSFTLSLSYLTRPLRPLHRLGNEKPIEDKAT